MLTMTGVLFAAAFSVHAATYTLTITTTGPVSPSLITSAPSGISCPGICSSTFTKNTPVTLTASPASTMTFAGWIGSNGCKTNLRDCTFTRSSATAVTAVFNPSFRLSLSGNGIGTVTSSTNNVNCSVASSCSKYASQRYSYPKGTVIVLTAVAQTGSTFVGWTGNAGCSTASTCTFTLNGYNVIIATFSSTGPYVLKVNVRGSGRVVSSPAGIRCGSTCAVAFSSGTSIALTTTAASGFFFAGWANGGCSGKNPCTVVSSSAYQALGGADSPTATFYPQ